MQKTIFTILILFLTVFTKAQIKEGTILINGSFSGSFTKATSVDNTDDSYSTLKLTPSIKGGYFISDNLAFGLVATNHFEKRFTDFVDTNHTNIFAGGVFFRQMFRKGDVKPFMEVSYTYGASDYHYINYSTFRNHTYTLGLGAAIFLSPKVAVELFFPIQYMISKEIEDYPTFVGINQELVWQQRENIQKVWLFHPQIGVNFYLNNSN